MTAKRLNAISTADLGTALRGVLERPGSSWSIARLARESGLTERKIHGVLVGEYATTSMDVADRLLCTLGLTHLLMTGEVGYVADGRGRRPAKPQTDRAAA